MSEPPEELEFESTGQKVMTGTVLGIGVFLVNYVGVYTFLKADGAESNYDGMPLWKFAGQTLYNAQWAPTEVGGRGQSLRTISSKVRRRIPRFPRRWTTPS